MEYQLHLFGFYVLYFLVLNMVNVGCTFYDNILDWVDGSTGMPSSDFFNVIGPLATACVVLVQASPGVIYLFKVVCNIAPEARYLCENKA